MAEPTNNSTETKPLQPQTSLPMENAPNPAYPPQQYNYQPIQNAPAQYPPGYYPPAQPSETDKAYELLKLKVLASAVKEGDKIIDQSKIVTGPTISSTINNNNNNNLINNSGGNDKVIVIKEPVEPVKPVYRLKAAGCCIALLVFFMNLCIPGWGTIFGACYYTSICSSLVCEGIIEFICIPILYGWCRALCVSINFLNSACSGLEFDRYYTI